MKEKDSIVKKLYRDKDIKKIVAKVNLFGVNVKFTPEYFLNLRLYTSTIIFLICFLFFDNGFLYAPIISVFYYYFLTYYMIELPLKKRSRKLDRESFYFFEVLTLALESGRNLETSISMACKYIDSDISNEFKQTLKEVHLGKSLKEALEEMRLRIPSDAINNIILNIMQSSLFGNSIIETMYNQLEFLRDKQIMDIKEEINKIPNKISIFSVLFFIPLILLIILAPVLLDFLN